MVDKVWVVTEQEQHYDTYWWAIIGIFLTEQEAIDCCERDNDFIMVIPIGIKFPRSTIDVTSEPDEFGVYGYFPLDKNNIS